MEYLVVLAAALMVTLYACLIGRALRNIEHR
jgi:hypothetical protein